jgi:hypothetical protein
MQYEPQPPKDFKVTDVTRQKMSLAKKGKFGCETNPWKGESAGYSAVHRWLVKRYGSPKKCEHCGRENGRISWANKNHQYKRNIEEYIGLCMSCHKKYDNKLFRKLHNKKCIVCGKIVKTLDRNRKYCSIKCTGLYWYKVNKLKKYGTV